VEQLSLPPGRCRFSSSPSASREEDRLKPGEPFVVLVAGVCAGILIAAIIILALAQTT